MTVLEHIDCMNYNEMQVEHRVWLSAMYPDQPAYIPAAGMVEEAGELLHTLLKMEQSEIWGKESRHGDLDAKLKDAVGDCAIYTCSLCNAMNWDFEKCVRIAETMREYQNVPMKLAVDLVRTAASSAFAPSIHECVVYLRVLMDVCGATGVDFLPTVELTWRTVKERRR